MAPEYHLTVDGETLTWDDGKCLVFDDSYLHSVKHTSFNNDKYPSNEIIEQEDRVVLIIDLWHPDLSEEEREAINICFNP